MQRHAFFNKRKKSLSNTQLYGGQYLQLVRPPCTAQVCELYIVVSLSTSLLSKTVSSILGSVSKISYIALALRSMHVGDSVVCTLVCSTVASLLIKRISVSYGIFYLTRVDSFVK